MRRTWLHAGLLLMLAACTHGVGGPAMGDGGTGGGNSGNGGGGGGGGGQNGSAVPTPGTADVVLYRPLDEWTPRTDPITQETSMELVQTYRLGVLFKNGLAYVGKEKNAIDDIACTSASDVCVAYSISGATITVGGETLAYAQSGTDVTIGSDKWTIVTAPGSLDGDWSLAGFFGYQSGTGAIVEGVSLHIDAGRIVVKRTAPPDARRLPKMVFGVELWPDCVRPPANGCTLETTYTLGKHTLSIEGAKGERKTFFLRHQGGELQIGDDWYSQ